MSTPPRATRPATAHATPTPQRWFALVDDDPVDIRCFMCMAEVIQTWACLSEEGRPRLFCKEKCMKDYWITNRLEPAKKDVQDDRAHSPAIRRPLSEKVCEYAATASSTTHIDLSKRVTKRSTTTPPSTPSNKSMKRNDGNE